MNVNMEAHRLVNIARGCTLIGFVLLVLLLNACTPLDRPEGQLIFVPTASPTATYIKVGTQPPPPHCTVTTGVPNGDLNLRRGAGTEYEVMMTLKEGATYEVLESLNGWFRLRFNGFTGWVNSSYCKMGD